MSNCLEPNTTQVIEYCWCEDTILTRNINVPLLSSKCMASIPTLKFWRNKVQAEIRTCKESYYKNKVDNMKDYNISKWWKEIKKLGCGSSRTEWCEQLMGEAIGSMEELVENINSFFVNLSSDYQPLEDDSSYQA